MELNPEIEVEVKVPPTPEDLLSEGLSSALLDRGRWSVSGYQLFLMFFYVMFYNSEFSCDSWFNCIIRSLLGLQFSQKPQSFSMCFKTIAVSLIGKTYIKIKHKHVVSSGQLQGSDHKCGNSEGYILININLW